MLSQSEHQSIVFTIDSDTNSSDQFGKLTIFTLFFYTISGRTNNCVIKG